MFFNNLHNFLLSKQERISVQRSELPAFIRNNTEGVVQSNASGLVIQTKQGEIIIATKTSLPIGTKVRVNIDKNSVYIKPLPQRNTLRVKDIIDVERNTKPVRAYVNNIRITEASFFKQHNLHELSIGTMVLLHPQNLGKQGSGTQISGQIMRRYANKFFITDIADFQLIEDSLEEGPISMVIETQAFSSNAQPNFNKELANDYISLYNVLINTMASEEHNTEKSTWHTSNSLLNSITKCILSPTTGLEHAVNNLYEYSKSLPWKTIIVPLYNGFANPLKLYWRSSPFRMHAQLEDKSAGVITIDLLYHRERPNCTNKMNIVVKAMVQLPVTMRCKIEEYLQPLHKILELDVTFKVDNNNVDPFRENAEACKKLN